MSYNLCPLSIGNIGHMQHIKRELCFEFPDKQQMIKNLVEIFRFHFKRFVSVLRIELVTLLCSLVSVSNTAVPLT